MIIGVVRTEKALKLATAQNTIPFIVDLKATKQEIKQEIERVFNAKVEKIRTHVVRGRKVAYVKFAKDVNVEELATNLNLA